LILSVDAGPDGVGALPAHEMGAGVERPVTFASLTLASAERNYGQFHKGLLALKFGLSKFHQFLFGRPFVAYTGHRPLMGLLKNQTLVG